MLPVISIFEIQISTYWMAMALGFVAMLLLMLRRREIFSLNKAKAAVFTVLLMTSGLLGCKLLYVAENMQDVVENGFKLGGFSFFGAVFLIPLLMMAFSKIFHMTPQQSLDASAPCVALMVGIIRVGCFLNGCCGGHQVIAFGQTMYWPTQAIESIGDIIIVLFLLGLEEKQSRKGNLYPIFMLCYGLLRFAVEFLRDTPKDWVGLSHGQWFAVISVGIGIFSLLNSRNDTKKRRKSDFETGERI